MGGKRKKSAKAPLKKESRFKVPVIFKCPGCDQNSINIIMRREGPQKIAHVSCKNCTQKASIDMLPLEEPVDAYFKFYEDYLSECRKADEDEAGTRFRYADNADFYEERLGLEDEYEEDDL